MITSIRAGALSCALLATTCFTIPADAQTPRQYRNLDANGVDLTHGDYLMSVVEGSIGSGDGALALVRTRIGSGNGQEHSSSGGSQWDGIALQQSPKFGGGIVTSVIKDFRFEQFSPTGTLPTGSTLTAVGSGYDYRTADGTVIAFGDPAGHTAGASTFCNGSAGQTYCLLVPSSITAPDGKTVSIAWDLWTSCNPQMTFDDPLDCSFWVRIASVSNSHGYRIAFSYASEGSGSFNGVPPPNSWARRTGATFHNDAAGGAALASVSYAYPSNSIVDVTDTGGRAWRFTGDASRIIGIRRPGAASDTTSIAYSGAQVTAIARDGVTTNYARGVSGNTATTTVTNALSQQATVTSDLAIGRPTAVSDALGRTTAYQYDGAARLTRVTAPEGNSIQYTLDARGNVTQTQAVAKPSSGAATITTSATFEAGCSNPLTCNQPISTTDARGFVTDYAYDPTHGGVTSVTAPAASSGVRPQTRYGYTLANGEYRLTSASACRTLASCTGTADEVKSAIGYDANGNVTSTSAGAGDGSLTASQAMTYDGLGNLLTVDGPLPGAADTTRLRYDAARQVVGTVSPDPDGAGALKPRAVRTTYRPDGQVVKTERGNVADQSDAAWAAFAPAEAVEVAYDANARPVTNRLTAGGATHALSQTSYDALGRPECGAQRMNPAAFGGLPASACTPSTAGSFGPDRIGKRVYDAAGQVTQVQSAVGTAEARTETMVYTPNGQVAHVIDGESNRTTYAYDGHDRLVRIRYPVPTKGANASSPTDYEELGYDPASNVVSRRVRDGQVINYTYDSLSRPTAKNLPGSEPDVNYSYDLLGRLTSADQPGHALVFGYDALGRTVTQTGPHGAVTSAYDLAGRRTRLTHPDGFYFDHDYLVTGELVRIRENGATSGVGLLATFAYDDHGRRIGLTRGNGTTTAYSYDPVSRLASLSEAIPAGPLQTLGFAYSPAGQIASATRSNDGFSWLGHGNGTTATTSNGLNQIASGGVSYDARGNMTADGLGRTFGYSSENLLTSVSGGHMLSYDPLMRLYEVAGTPVTRQAYDGAEVVAEYGATGALIRRHVYGPGSDEPIIWYEGTGTADRRFVHGDERGTIFAVTNSAGTFIAGNRHDEYGRVAPANWGRHQFTGQAWFGELGLHNYKARFYHPGGWFMQTDRIGYGDGLNMYNGMRGDPVNGTDPTGMQAEDCGGPCDAIIVNGNRLIAPPEKVGVDGLTVFASVATAGYIPREFEPGLKGEEEAIVVTGQRPTRRPQRRQPSPNRPILQPASFGDPQGSKKDWCGGADAVTSNLPEGAWAGACQAHDVCYDQSGSTRGDCDSRLFRDVLVECSERTYLPGPCAVVAASAYLLVRFGGQLFYEPAPGVPNWFRW